MKNINHKNTLLIGIGNSGRSDDGLGWAFVETISESGSFNGECLLRYQLQIEDAELIRHYDQVIFVDAFDGQTIDGFIWKGNPVARNFSFSTHELAPETVLFLCQDLYGKKPDAKLLCIQGHKWTLEIGMSQRAQKNLEKALQFFEEMLIPSSEEMLV